MHYAGPLKPNCLLTRCQVVFVWGKRNPFQFRNYWGLLPSIAAEHGYEAWNLRLPWRKGRIEALEKNLSRLSKPAHLICDRNHQEEIRMLLSSHSHLKEKVKSVTYLERDNSRPIIEQRDLLLSHLVQLAELDFLD